MTEPADGAAAVRRASLVVAGRSIVRHQIDVALALRAQLVICLVDAPRPELTVLRAEVEGAGARLESAQDAADLRRLCGPGDELLVIADGLLADPGVTAELLQSGPAVLVQPAEIALPLGFERLDLARAAGGMMLVPGELLGELPDEYDAASALTRIALQAGVPTREVPDEARRGGHWRLVRGEAEAHAIDDEWVAFNLGEGRDARPSETLARVGVRAFGSTLLHAGRSSRFLALGAAILLLMALASGWLDAAALAFAMVGIGTVVGQGALLLLRVEGGAATPQAGPRTLGAVFDALLDATLILLMIWATPAFPAETLTGRAFAPLMLIGLVRLGSTLYLPRYARWLGDRAVISLALLIATGLHALPAGVELFALALAFGASIHLTLGTGRRHW